MVAQSSARTPTRRRTARPVQRYVPVKVRRRALIEGDAEMKRLLSAAVAVGLLACSAAAVPAQTPGEVFRKVAPSVVVIRAKGRDIGTSGQSRFAETGSGVLISSDGKVMTAAHVVHSMDEINVEFLGGETVKARVVASEPAADLSLLQ